MAVRPGLRRGWLTVVESLGYPLSEVEAQMRAHWSTPLEDEDGPADD